MLGHEGFKSQWSLGAVGPTDKGRPAPFGRFTHKLMKIKL